MEGIYVTILDPIQSDIAVEPLWLCVFTDAFNLSSTQGCFTAYTDKHTHATKIEIEAISCKRERFSAGIPFNLVLWSVLNT